MTDVIVDRVDQCEIRWYPRSDSDPAALVAFQATREKILRKMRALGHTRRHRQAAPNYAKIREATEARGLARIMATPSEGERVHIVRIYYRSMGGEVLACDSDPLTSSEAGALMREHIDDTRPTLASLGCERYRDGAPRGLREGVRLVTLPSQRVERVDVTVESPEVAPAMTVRQSLGLFQAASARRLARLSRRA
jgi:hypothetical protein